MIHRSTDFSALRKELVLQKPFHQTRRESRILCKDWINYDQKNSFNDSSAFEYPFHHFFSGFPTSPMVPDAPSLQSWANLKWFLSPKAAHDFKKDGGDRKLKTLPSPWQLHEHRHGPFRDVMSNWTIDGTPVPEKNAWNLVVVAYFAVLGTKLCSKSCWCSCKATKPLTSIMQLGRTTFRSN